MRNRMLLMTLYSVALFSLAAALRLSLAVWLLVLIAALPGVFRRLYPAIRFSVEVLVVALMIVAVGRPWGVTLAVVMAVAALSIARSEHPSPDRAILGSVPIVVVASFIQPAVVWSFLLLAAIAVLALVVSPEPDRKMERQRLRLALIIALIAGLGATAAGLIIHVLPWQTVIATTFSIIAYPFIAVFSHIHLLAHPSTRNPLRSALGSHRMTHGLISHAPLAIIVILVVVAAILLILLLYAAFRYWARNDDNLEPDASDLGIIREDLLEEVPDFFHGLRQRLAPVRSLVAKRLRQARRHHQLRRPSETLREWMGHNQPNVDAEISQLYEEIRYGDAEDTLAKRRQAETRWPRP